MRLCAARIRRFRLISVQHGALHAPPPYPLQLCSAFLSLSKLNLAKFNYYYTNQLTSISLGQIDRTTEPTSLL
jgi:hypothetical protein